MEILCTRNFWRSNTPSSPKNWSFKSYITHSVPYYSPLFCWIFFLLASTALLKKCKKKISFEIWNRRFIQKEIVFITDDGAVRKWDKQKKEEKKEHFLCERCETLDINWIKVFMKFHSINVKCIKCGSVAWLNWSVRC